MSVSTIPFGNKHTPDQVLIDAMNTKAKMVVVVILDEHDCIEVAWSDGSVLKRLGMLEIAKIHMVEAISEID